MEVWIKDFTPDNLPDKPILLDRLEKRKLCLKKWGTCTTAEAGLVITNDNIVHERLLNFLTLNTREKGQRVILINFNRTAFSTNQLLQLFKAGVEYVFQFSEIIPTLDCVINKLERWRNINSMLRSPVICNVMAGNSTGLKKVLQELIEVSLFAPIPVLICGERGTGKELMARLVHEFDGRKEKGNFVVVDCTTLKKELAGSELFGHEKGSFTGADYTREGAFSLANNGTLFLDEIGELPLNLQSELLRIIQEGTYKKTGSNIWKHTSFRLVAATNKNLEQELELGNFRHDLYDRISVYKCTLPSLHERKEDIPELLNFFFHQQFKIVPDIDKTVIDFLCERKYSGNIRELKNIISRIFLRYTGNGPVTLGDVVWYDMPSGYEKKQEWYEKNEFVSGIKQAIQEGYDMKQIDDIVKGITMQTALIIHGKNKLVSQVLGVSDRWVQQRRAKRKTNNEPAADN
jgi:transcriptional regulator with GAF, ATPase, and Fis domain